MVPLLHSRRHVEQIIELRARSLGQGPTSENLHRVHWQFFFILLVPRSGIGQTTTADAMVRRIGANPHREHMSATACNLQSPPGNADSKTER